MNYYIRETINGDPNAGSKARNDAADIFGQSGWMPITLNFVYNEKLAEKTEGIIRKIVENVKLRAEWGKCLKAVGAGDAVAVQFPVLRRPALLALAFSKIKKRGGRIILLVHDLELLRYASRTDVKGLKKQRIVYEENSVLALADKIIVHNSKMKEKMVGMGYDAGKLIELGIFDYLIPNYQLRMSHGAKKNSVAIAGTLRPHKTKYLQLLPQDVDFELYGIGYEDQGMKNVHYHGAFPPDELPMKMEAGFGLVWDGDTANTCSGTYGEYLRINNPHKTSLYLASGMPVIIWKEAALAGFVEKNKCGFSVSSLNEIGKRISDLTEEDYEVMQNNALEVSEKLRKGYYTKAALSLISR